MKEPHIPFEEQLLDILERLGHSTEPNLYPDYWAKCKAKAATNITLLIESIVPAKKKFYPKSPTWININNHNGGFNACRSQILTAIRGGAKNA